MSIIDKIAVGLNTKRSGNNLPFDCSTTANIGVIQPTMCREMAPQESLHVKVNSLVRLLALQNPTFGRMSLRHYHTFVPYNKLWRPFDAMMSNQPFPFTLPDGERSERYYTSTPTMSNSFITGLVMAFSDKSVALTTDPGTPIAPGQRIKYNDTYQNIPTDAAEFVTWWNSFIVPLAVSSAPFQEYSLDDTDIFSYQQAGSTHFGLGYDDLGVFNLGNFYSVVDTVSVELSFNKLTPGLGNLRIYDNENSVITQENADFIYKSGVFIYYFKYKPILKKLRQIFMGLGYGFSPALSRNIVHNPFKLMAYYASCFELFHPKREISFTQTSLYYVIENCLGPESFTPVSQEHPDETAIHKAFSEFIFRDLPKMTYYLSMDYFSASVRSVVENNQNGESANTVVSGSIGSFTQQNVKEVSIVSQQGQPLNTPAVDAGNPLAQRLALTLMRYVNKNTVIGRSIADYLRVHFGITDVLDELHTPVIRIGSSRININISDVMSTADTRLGLNDAGSALGSYAGKGIGYGESETFDFKAETFGCWLTLTVIVPESGFYQGYLRENRHITRNDFFNEAYDALGYQVLERGEVSADFTAASDITGEFNPARDFEVRRGFGFIPRYSEYKVGRNIVNGDLSLRSTQNSMASFTLDRRFPTERLEKSNRSDGSPTDTTYFLDIKMPSYVPTFVYDGFRAIDQTDVVGNYNRIFSYTGNDFDHFIIHNVFEVRAVAPWKPLSSSFDTFDDEDNTHVMVNKA